MTFGSGAYQYEFAGEWGELPDGWEWGEVAGVACDSRDRVFVYARGEHPLTVFDANGEFIAEWGAGALKVAHGIFVDEDDHVYCTDRARHAVLKFDPNGNLVRTFGSLDEPSEGAPFHIPTDCATSPTGDLFVSDGYGNRLVHRFSAAGELKLSWGEDGAGPGQFSLVHCVRLDRDGNVWVCDRENRRVQVFDQDGTYIREIGELQRPDTLFFDRNEDVVYMAELEYQVTICALDGETLAQWGGGKESDAPGEFVGWPHGIWVDSTGDLYVSQVHAQNRVNKYVRI